MEAKDKNTVFALVGPTCTCKTELSIELSRKHSFEIISADSRLVYKEMDIGTSKPSIEDRKKVPHHMIDIVEPNENYSVALYKKQTSGLISEIFKRGKSPLFVGGTGLYLSAVLSGLSIPEVKPDYKLREKLKNIPQQELYRTLQEKDPDAGLKINQNDNFRTIRALEVINSTGELFSIQKTKTKIPFNVIWIGLAYKDKTLHMERIKVRAKRFLTNGFIDEVKNLLGRYGELELFKHTIGYAEGVSYIKGEISEEQMIENITLSTKQLAKRQMTWFKANKEIGWVYLDGLDYLGALNLLEEKINLSDHLNSLIR